jgi:cell shape-determining protein MreD
MFILLLPATYPPLAVLLLSGAIGLSVDFFSGSIMGLNMAACLVMGYARAIVLKMVTTSSDTQQEIPVIHRTEIRKVLTYTASLVFIYHFVLFSLEAFSISKILFILIRTVTNSITTTLLIILFESFLYRK